MIKEASKDDILQEKEFEKWCSKNYSQILHWFDKILDYERNLLIQEGKIEKIEIVKYKVFKIHQYIVDSSLMDEAKVKEYSVQLPSLKEKMDQTKALYDVEKDKYQSLKTKRDRIVSVKNTLDENKQQQVQLTNTIRTNANLLVENQTKTEEIQKNQPILEKESLRLEMVSSLYQAILQDKEENNTVSLSQEEMQLFDALRKAKKAVKEANQSLQQAQSFYNTKKDAYNASNKKLEDAKSALAIAQLELNKYLITQKGPGWHRIDNDWYYVNASNEIVKDQWVNNYYFEDDGTSLFSTITYI